MQQGRHIAHKFESGLEVGVIKTFDKKGLHAGKFSVKYKDDPNWCTHSLLREGVRVMEKTSTGFCWDSRAVIPLEVTMTVSAGGPIFCCFIEVTMTVVKSVSDGLRDCEIETQLNLNRPLRISPGPRHLSRPLAT